eukprot:1145-Chlamydomonas_euryale.AAC.1
MCVRSCRSQEGDSYSIVFYEPIDAVTFCLMVRAPPVWAHVWARGACPPSSVGPCVGCARFLVAPLSPFTCIWPAPVRHLPGTCAEPTRPLPLALVFLWHASTCSPPSQRLQSSAAAAW